ncbi:LytR/AlgR family response regulator transcription factor [Dyadobacter fanqingshengii]|uniref:LytTR family DNA-binding domain-containing protein n=1 Tax=Dyadobacter fanqingshengii TaxID=2906443 RepID=A0A9X1T9J6_9BACT|nr:LytTR family DNA-binding domain-containing protein [Dyadobacter fanqingshengii]MCF0041390.1 LytTR family DNA-binding domain-containing protein [Dyadobacter fanqingshengii]USJ36889.1 LytTR family DNA-binding domain-containing protein [Dyadobacter fanqingshengii]
MIRCLIVDDEEPARELIKLHLSDLDGFEVAASLSNALDAFTFLQKNSVDIVFLDIRMPRISGLELVRSLKYTPRIILTTAYREYAAEAFEIDVFDYLVKPITHERFMKAIAKYMHYQSGQAATMDTQKNDDHAYMFFKVGRDQVKVFLKDILYIEGLADYIKVHTKDKSYIASEKLGYMEEKLPLNSFVRIHKSFIIALDKISSYNADQVILNNNKALPLGRLFKAGFLTIVQIKKQS